jgi:DNA-binding XRE family transcriptional regulator
MHTKTARAHPPFADGRAPAPALAAATCTLSPENTKHPFQGGRGDFSRTRKRSRGKYMTKKATEKKTLLEWHRLSGLSVQDFADALGVSIQTASNYLKGRNEPGVVRAVKMAETLKVRVEDVDWSADPKALEFPAMPEGEGVTPERLAVAKVWLSKGKTKAEVAKTLGISRQALYDYLP